MAQPLTAPRLKADFCGRRLLGLPLRHPFVHVVVMASHRIRSVVRKLSVNPGMQ